MVFLDNEGTPIKPQSETIELEATEKVPLGTKTSNQLMVDTKILEKPQSVSTSARCRRQNSPQN